MQHIGKTLKGLISIKLITKIFLFQGCVDNYAKCPEWSMSGACGMNPEFMAFNCRESCGACGFKSGTYIRQMKLGKCGVF